MKIDKIRKRIEKIDKKIIKCLVKRKEFAKRISKIKKKGGLKIIQKDREKEVFRNVDNYNNRYGKDKLSSQFISNIFKQIILESRKAQK